MRRATRALGGAFRYEYLMQVRRSAVWLGFALLALLVFAASNAFIGELGKRSVGRYGVYDWTTYDVMIEAMIGVNFILVLGAGLLLADRVRRDRSIRVDEVLAATPASITSRLMGKYLGSVLATLTPMFLIYVVGITLLMFRLGDVGLLLPSLAAFALLVIPPTLFVGAYSIACTTVMWSPLFQFLFVGYWLWSSLNPSDPLPTLNGTALNPAENLVISGIFHELGSKDGFYHPVSPWLGVANIVTLLGAGAVALLAAQGALRWQASRR